MSEEKKSATGRQAPGTKNPDAGPAAKKTQEEPGAKPDEPQREGLETARWKATDPREASRIYFLPNLMTAGNLFCGFLAVIRCIQAKFASVQPEAALQASLLSETVNGHQALSARLLYEQAVWLILAAVIFDSLDGRLARLGGRESLFGKEFDSIADVVSFGMAPALLVFFLILSPTETTPYFQIAGWVVGFIYLLCASVRLARFNVITNPLIISKELKEADYFQGLPVPAAAGMIASLVMVLNRTDLNTAAIFLPILLLLIALLMVSTIPYPSFKKISWTMEVKMKAFIIVFIAIVFIYVLRSYLVALAFLAYIFWGVVRFFLKGGKITQLFDNEKYVETIANHGANGKSPGTSM